MKLGTYSVIAMLTTSCDKMMDQILDNSLLVIIAVFLSLLDIFQFASRFLATQF